MFTSFLIKWQRFWHYRTQLKVLRKKMWDAEFLITKHREEREDYRLEYDRLRELVDAATLRIEEENTKEDPDKTILESLEKLIATNQPKINQCKEHMQNIDTMIEGRQAPQDKPEERVVGINEMIAGYRNILTLVDQHRKI